MDEVAEEGSAEVTAGVETSEDKVWMVTADVLLGRDTGAARRPFFPKVLRLEIQVRGFLNNIRTSKMFGGSELLAAGPAWSQRIFIVNTIHRLQLFDEGFP